MDIQMRKSIKPSGNSTNTRPSIPNSHKLDYHGLYNQGATCYLNSVLQVFFMTKDFREAVESNCEQVSQFIDPHLKILFNELKKTTARTVHITRKLNVEKLYEQHDAAEYFEKILSETSPALSVVFQGQLRHRTTCSQCNTHCDEDGPFWTLPVSMDALGDSFKLADGFHEFFKTSEVSGLNQMYCDECDAKADATIECSIIRHPEVLTLLLKRFEFDYDSMSYVKINSHVDVPQTLNSEFNTYELYAVVDHSGSLRGGHYTTTIKSYDNDKWYEFNDSHVRLANPQLFKKQNAVQSCTAYLLMYQKVCAPGSKITNGPDPKTCFAKEDGIEPIALTDDRNSRHQLIDHNVSVMKRSTSQLGYNEGEQSDSKKRKVQEGELSESDKEVNDHDNLGKEQAREDPCLEMTEKQGNQGGVQLNSAEEASYFNGQKPQIPQSEMVAPKGSNDSNDNDTDVKGQDDDNGDDDDGDYDIDRQRKVQHSKTQPEQMHKQTSVENVTSPHKDSLKIKEQALPESYQSEFVEIRKKDEGMQRQKEKVRSENTQNEEDVAGTTKKLDVTKDTSVQTMRDIKEAVPTHSKSDKSSVKSLSGIVAHNDSNDDDTDVMVQEDYDDDDDDDDDDDHDRNRQRKHKVHYKTQHEQMNKQTRVENEASLKEFNVKEQVLPQSNQSEFVEIRRKDEGMERPKEKVRSENTQNEEAVPMHMKSHQSTPRGSVKKQGCVVENKDLRRETDVGETAKDLPSTAPLHQNTLTRSQATETKTPGCCGLPKKTYSKRKKGGESENIKRRKSGKINTKGTWHARLIGLFNVFKKRSPLVKPNQVENSLLVEEQGHKLNEDLKNHKSIKNKKINKVKAKVSRRPLDI